MVLGDFQAEVYQAAEIIAVHQVEQAASLQVDMALISHWIAQVS